ncbi:MAG: hypothetical protein L3J93_02210 [Thermoplasmata archaeon]|nr:hypothetical protein [Thermoplasmata archaeon]
MDVRSTSRHRRRFRQRIRQDRRGVVSVIGTLLALLVFFALFGVFLTQYLPLWMSEDEETLAVQTQTSFATLKSDVDLQAAAGGPAVVASPFQMSSQSIPLISQPTVATLSFIPTSAGLSASVTMTPGPGGSVSAFTQSINLGILTMQLPNRYYSPQTFSFENDAVVQGQGATQQILDFPPAFAINQTGPGTSVTAGLVQLVGSSSQATSVGPQEVFSHFLFAETFQSTSPTKTLTALITENTFYPCAWETFYSNTIKQAGLDPTALSSLVTPAAPATCAVGASSSPTTVTVAFTGLYSFTLLFSEMRLVIGVGVE